MEIGNTLSAWGSSLSSAASSFGSTCKEYGSCAIEKGRIGVNKTVGLVKENPKTALITSIAVATVAFVVAYTLSGSDSAPPAPPAPPAT